MELTLGYIIPKPVTTQEECDAYAAMAQAVNDHNADCKVGDTLWSIEDKPDCYEVVEGDVVPEPQPAQPTTAEQIATIKTVNAALISQLTDLQVALCSLYEKSKGGETT